MQRREELGHEGLVRLPLGLDKIVEGLARSVRKFADMITAAGGLPALIAARVLISVSS
jgi:hypothetical protein